MFVTSLGRTDSAESSVVKSLRTVEPTLKSVLICKKAYADDSGHNVYEGEFRTITVTKTPAVAEELFVVTKWGDGAGRDFRQEIKIFEPHGALEVFTSRELEKDFKLGNIYHEHLIIGRVSGLLLPKEGRYRLEIYMNGEPKGKAYLNVVAKPNERPIFAESEEREPAETSVERFKAKLRSMPLPIFIPLPLRPEVILSRAARD